MIWPEAMPSSFTDLKTMLSCGRSKSVIFNEYQRGVARRRRITPNGAGQGNFYLWWQTALATSTESLAGIATERTLPFGANRPSVAAIGRAIRPRRTAVTWSVERSLSNADPNSNRSFARSRHRHAVYDRGTFAFALQFDRAGARRYSKDW